MPLLSPGVRPPGKSFVVASLIAEEPWGELWRAADERHGRVLVLLYTTAEGERLFLESLMQLRQWKALAPRTVSLLPILEIQDREAIPTVLLADTGGPTLHDYHRVSKAYFMTRGQLEWAREMAAMIDLLHSHAIVPAGISTRIVFHGSRDGGALWRLAPVAPGHPEVYQFLAGGELLPSGYSPGGESWKAGLDTWALARIWAALREEDPEEAISDEFAGPIDREARDIISRCLRRGRDGAYPAAASVVRLLDDILESAT